MTSSAVAPHSFEQLMRVLDQIFDYLSLDPSAKETISDLINKKAAENQEIVFTDIFKDENIVSEDDSKAIELFDDHLAVLNLDQQFGRLALANNMASADDIATAIEYQKTSFEKYRINTTLGDILVENRVMTKAQCNAVLLTQDRISDEDLPGALNDLGETAARKESVNKRFGAIAIKKERVTIDQVNEALQIRETEQQENKAPRFISLILQETAGLSEQEALEVLLSQKYYEKRLLDLEKALYTQKDEIKVSKRLNSLFVCSISADGLEAVLKKRSEADAPVSAYELYIWLRRAGIRSWIATDDVLETFITSGDKNAKIVAATGSAPGETTNDRVQFHFDTGPSDEQPDGQQEPGQSPGTEASGEPDSDESPNESIDTSGTREASDGTESDTGDDNSADRAGNDDSNGEDRTSSDTESEEPKEEGKNDVSGNPGTASPTDAPQSDQEHCRQKSPAEPDDTGIAGESQKNTDAVFVKENELLATIIPGRAGRTGRDVLGNSIKAPKPQSCDLSAGRGVIRKGGDFFAQAAGRPMVRGGTVLAVEPAVTAIGQKTLTKDITADTKEKYEMKNLDISGNIATEGLLRCHSLRLAGKIIGGVVCTGDLDVRGEIGFQAPSGDDAGPAMTSVICNGSVKVSKSVTNADIRTNGDLAAFNATITGSRVIALKGITVKSVVSGGQSPCILRFGVPPGDKIIMVDQTIEAKKEELVLLKKEADKAELTAEFSKQLEKEETIEMKQTILKNLKEVIEAPELYQHEGLKNKIIYLKGLPDFSSIKNAYLKLPETERGLAYFNQIILDTAHMPDEPALQQLKQKILSDPDTPQEISEVDRIKTEFNARMDALEQEIATNSQQIETLENDVLRLTQLKEKLCRACTDNSPASIVVRNRCQKGTVIKGRQACLIVEKDLYHVVFKEGIDPSTGKAAILITS